jgi:YD repeat-containing protein
VRTVREQVPGAVTVPGDDPASILQAQNAVRVVAPNAAYLIEEEVHDSEGQMTQRIDARGYRSFFEYDAQGRLTAQVQSANLATRDPSPQQELEFGTAVVNGATVSVALGYTPPDPAWFQLQAARTEYGYDAQGNRTLVIRPKSFTRTVPDSGTYWVTVRSSPLAEKCSVA